MTHARFGLLGPLLVEAADAPRPIRAGKQRNLLACLLLRANQPTSVDQLVEAIWDDDAPPQPMDALYNYVLRLRQALGGQLGARLVTQTPGYLIEVTDDELDLHQFHRLRDAGRQAMARHRWQEADTAFRDALACWRGDPLADIPSTVLRERHVPTLLEARLQVHEWHVEARLNLGQHDELIGELQQLAAANPMRERVHQHLMLALARAGRQAEALTAYRRLRDTIVDQLGVDPNPDIRDLHQRILTGDVEPPEPSAPPAAPLPDADPGPATVDADAAPSAETVPVPAQLPPDIIDFTGRDDQVRRIAVSLAASLTTDADAISSQRGAVAISAMSGAGGIGKTTLAVHIGHSLRDQFPDGQLYVNLLGATQPLDPASVLSRFLRDLGVDGSAIPLDLEERAATFRSRVADRRMLLLLDDARDARQVRPLLPGTQGCRVLITSRRKLSDLPGTTLFDLDALDAREAHALFTSIIGEPRAAAEPEATADVLRACAGLPLAVRVAAARLGSRPRWTVRHLADRLREKARTLDELATGDASVRVSFDVSYAALNTSATPRGTDPARAFRLLGLHEGADISLPAACALLDLPEAEAERTLEHLVDISLLDETRPGRYRLHDLLHSYATERAELEETAADRLAAARRLLSWYLTTGRHANIVAMPEHARPDELAPEFRYGALTFADAQDATAWLDTELGNILSVAQMATRHGLDDLGWRLGPAIWGYLHMRKHYASYTNLYTLGLACAQRADDLSGMAWTHNGLALAYMYAYRHAEALEHFELALAIRRQLGETRYVAGILSNMAGAKFELGDPDGAIAVLLESLAIFDDLGEHTLSRGMAMSNLSEAYMRLGDYDAAIDYAEQALAASRKMGNQWMECTQLQSNGELYGLSGQHELGISCLKQSIELATELGAPAEIGVGYRHLGELYASIGRVDEARDELAKALAIMAQCHDPDENAVRARLTDLENPRNRSA
jgi:DNA-binding SARP family transcriptional activator